MGRKVFLLTDETVHRDCLGLLQEFLSPKQELEIIEVEDGEQSKSLDIYRHICEHLIECGAGKDDLLICLGGGMITDLGGFVGSTFKRGITFLHIPTSLLAMVDAANGGKNGINLGSVKNVLGTISSPHEILIYPGFLDTLADDELISGFAEVIKHGVIAGGEFWEKVEMVEEISTEEITPLIQDAVAIKDAITSVDLYEKGPRKKLNLGHTIGHAIESHFISLDHSIGHGIAVSLGMICETMIAKKLHLISMEDAQQIIQVILRWYHPSNYNLPEYDQLRGFISQDKKNSGGAIKMSLPTAIGKVEYNISVDHEMVQSCYEIFRQFARSENNSDATYLVSTI